MSLHKQLRFAVFFLQLWFVNPAPARTDFQPFPEWETGYFPNQDCSTASQGSSHEHHTPYCNLSSKQIVPTDNMQSKSDNNNRCAW